MTPAPAALRQVRGSLHDSTGGRARCRRYHYRQRTSRTQSKGKLQAGFTVMYQAGLRREAASGVKSAAASALPQSVQTAAYKAGLSDAAASLAREKAGLDFVSSAGSESGLVDSEYAQRLAQEKAGTAALLNTMGKELGLRVEIVPTVRGGSANGQYVASRNLIQIAADADNAIDFVAAHEVTHRMQELAPEEYRAYRDHAMRYRARESGEEGAAAYVERYRAMAEEAGVKLTQEEAMDEIAADFTRDMMENGKLFENFAKENRPAAKRMLDALKAFIEKIKALFRGKESRDAAAQSAYGKDMAELEACAALWQKAYDAAAKQAQNAKTAAREGDGEGRYQIKNIDGRLMTVIDTQNDTRAFKAAEAYLKTLVNTEHPFSTILMDAQPVYVGKDLPGEYRSSEYSKKLRKAMREVKMQAATNLDEMLLLAENGEWRENVKPKHVKDAMNGWYRYDTEFAVPILDAKKTVDHYTVYGGTLLIRNDADGKSYLYDLLDIEKKKVISAASFSAETHSEVFAPKPSTDSISASSGKVNGKFSLKPAAKLEQELNSSGLILTSKDNNKNNLRVRAWLRENYPELHVEFANDKATGHVSVKSVTDAESYQAEVARQRELEVADRQAMLARERFFKRVSTLSGNDVLYKSLENRLDKGGYIARGVTMHRSRSAVRTISFYIEDIERDISIKVSDHNTIGQQMGYNNTAFIDLRSYTSTNDVWQDIKKILDGRQNASHAAREGDGEGRYQLKDYSYDTLVSKPDMRITQIADTAPADRMEIVKQAKKNAAQIGKVSAENGSVSVYVRDIGRDVVLSTNGLKHGLDRRVSENGVVTIKAGEILQNSIRINELSPSKEAAAESYVLIGAAESQEGDLYIVRSVVNQFTSEMTSMDVLYAINAKKENRLRSMRPGVQRPVTDSTISISDLLKYVNKYFPDILPEDVLRHFGHSERPAGKLGESARFQLKSTDSTGRQLTEQQQEYFKDSKVRDAEGRLMPLYHQTDAEFTVFDTRHKGAGTGDNETPFGVFLKKSSKDIGVKGNRQMELYANIKNPLQVRDRSELVFHLARMSPEYEALKAKSDVVDKEYGRKFEKAKKDFVDFIAEWRRQNPNASRSALYEVDGFNRVFDAEDNIVEEWGKVKDELALQAKETITAALRNNGYDGVIISEDSGSFGRTTDAYIALDANQVKRTDNLNPTGDSDIRFQLKSATELEQEVRELKKERRALENRNKVLTERVAKWRGELRRTETPSVRPDDVKKLGRKFLSDYGSSTDYRDIEADMTALGKALLADDVSMETLRPHARAAAEKIIDGVLVQTESGGELLAIRDHLKNVTLRYTDDGSIPDFKAWKKANRGTLKISDKSGLDVDVAYSELTEMFGEGYFPSDIIQPDDQLLRISEVLEDVGRIYENPFDSYRDAAVTELADMLIDGMIGEDVRQSSPTFADRQALELQEAKARLTQMLIKTREGRDRQVARMQRHYQEQTKAGRERRNATSLRAKIARHTADLSRKLLNPTDKQHIPETLRQSVAALLGSINQESAYSYDENGKLVHNADGDPTKRTQAAIALKAAYNEIRNSGELVIDPDLLGSEGAGLLDQVEALSHKRIADMNSEELTTVWQAVRAIEHSVSTYNRNLAIERYAGVQEMADALRSGTASRRRVNRGVALDFYDPYSFFYGYGEAGMQIYRTLRNAQDKQNTMRLTCSTTSAQRVTAAVCAGFSAGGKRT